MKPASPVIKGYREVIYAKNQPQYNRLPSIRMGAGEVITRWHMTWRERLRALLRGDVYLRVLTFNEPLQPLAMSTEPPLPTGKVVREATPAPPTRRARFKAHFNWYRHGSDLTPRRGWLAAAWSALQHTRAEQAQWRESAAKAAPLILCFILCLASLVGAQTNGAALAGARQQDGTLTVLIPKTDTGVKWYALASQEDVDALRKETASLRSEVEQLKHQRLLMMDLPSPLLEELSRLREEVDALKKSQPQRAPSVGAVVYTDSDGRADAGLPDFNSSSSFLIPATTGGEVTAGSSSSSSQWAVLSTTPDAIISPSTTTFSFSDINADYKGLSTFLHINTVSPDAAAPLQAASQKAIAVDHSRCLPPAVILATYLAYQKTPNLTAVSFGPQGHAQGRIFRFTNKQALTTTDGSVVTIIGSQYDVDRAVPLDGFVIRIEDWDGDFRARLRFYEPGEALPTMGELPTFKPSFTIAPKVK
jgi:hypothetical protein